MSDLLDLKGRASSILREFKGRNYIFGPGALDEAPGRFTAEFGKKALLVGSIDSDWFQPVKDRIFKSMETAGIEVVGSVKSAAPNAPFVDVYRIHSHIMHKKPDAIVVAAAGSGTDAAKAAATLAALGDLQPEIDPFFGVGQVTKVCRQSGRNILPIVAIMTAASSAAHLTKYSNITDPVAGQKKLIVDEAIVPPRAVFDYDVTTTQPMSLTVDGSLDGVAHLIEVYFGASSEIKDQARRLTEVGLELIIRGLIQVKKDRSDPEARTLLGLGTDLGGYAIMIGGTSGAHLTSFSLVDVLSHGRACALMNPYYSVFFSTAVEEQLRVMGGIYKKYGFIDQDLTNLSGRDLGLAVAGGMIEFSRYLDFPTRLSEVHGISEDHIEKCLTAARNPQLDMKLRNMPVPLNADLVDEYMRPVLEAAWSGEFERIKTMT